MGGNVFHGFAGVPAAPAYRPSLPMMSRRDAALEKLQEDIFVRGRFVELNDTVMRCLGGHRLRGTDVSNCRTLASLVHSDLGPELRGASRSTASGYSDRERTERLRRLMKSRNIDVRCRIGNCKSFRLWQPDQHASSDVKIRLFERRLWELATAMRRRENAMISENFYQELQVLAEFCATMMERRRES